MCECQGNTLALGLPFLLVNRVLSMQQTRNNALSGLANGHRCSTKSVCTKLSWSGLRLLSTQYIYILLDVLLCSIADDFYELCRILKSPWGELKYKQREKFSAILHNKTIYYPTRQIVMFVRVNFAPVLCGTNTAWCLYSFRALFVLYEVQLDNKSCYLGLI